MEKTIRIGDREMRMRASALIPRMYRFHFKRDMVSDMRQLQKAFSKSVNLPENATDEEREDAQMNAVDLTIFEDVAWLMLKHSGEDVGESPDEWLDSIDGIFSVYEILPVILELWGDNLSTTSTARKK